MASIKDIFYDLGRKQAEASLPLAFIDFNEFTLDSEKRKQSLSLANKIVSLVKQHLKSEAPETEPNEEDVFNYLVLNGLVLTECVKLKNKGKKVTLELLMMSNNAKIINYCYTWNKPGEVIEVPKNVQKAVVARSIKEEDEEEGKQLTKEDDYVYLPTNALKLDFSKNKVTVPRVKSNVISVIPFEQIQGYVDVLLKKTNDNLVKIVYKKVNNTKRVQYISGNLGFLQQIYYTSPTLAQRFYESSLPPTGNFLNRTTPYCIQKGVLNFPDIGLNEYDSTIMRKINLGTILDVEYINDKTDKIFLELGRYANVNIAATLEKMQEGISSMTMEQMEAFWDILQNDSNMIKAERSKNKSIIEDLVTYLNYYILVNSTQGRKYLHDIMIANKELFPHYTEGLNLNKTSSTIEAEKLLQRQKEQFKVSDNFEVDTSFDNDFNF